MSMNPSIFKAYDIRGVYPTDLNEEAIRTIVGAIYSFLQVKRRSNTPLTLALGRDMRLSSPSLHKVAKETLVSCGATVVDLGLVSTPTFYFAVHHHMLDGGIQITASHNPKEYNGIKIVYRQDKGLVKVGKTTGMEEIKEKALAGVVPTGHLGTVRQLPNLLEEEVDSALTMTGYPPITPLTVIADAANAMGALYIDYLFKKIPGKLIRMNFELDGTFPVHQPDPLKPETLVDLQKRVIEEKADVGLAPDGDGDRLFFIDEQGKVIPASLITALMAREILMKHPHEKILFDVRYILTPKKIVEENGGVPIVTRVGHAFITETLNDTEGFFAGESSGHYFFRETGNAESQLPVIITVLAALTREQRKLSEIIKELARSVESGEINFKVTNAQEILTKLQQSYKDGELSTLDGVSIAYESWRFNVRTSNTEPLLRLNVEALTPNMMEEKREELIRLIKTVAENP